MSSACVLLQIAMKNNDNGVSEKVIFWKKKKKKKSFTGKHIFPDRYRHKITNTTLHPGLKPAFLWNKPHWFSVSLISKVHWDFWPAFSATLKGISSMVYALCAPWGTALTMTWQLYQCPGQQGIALGLQRGFLPCWSLLLADFHHKENQISLTFIFCKR